MDYIRHVAGEYAWLFPEHYQWLAALIVYLGVQYIPGLLARPVLWSSTLRKASAINAEAAKKQMAKSGYMAALKGAGSGTRWVRLVLYFIILPIFVTIDLQPWWEILIDTVAIVMIYDFFYYLAHRFLYHDGGFGPGPLLKYHAMHHRALNPCRMDTGYISAQEAAVGLALYGIAIPIVYAVKGEVSVIAAIVSWIVFVQMNMVNHTLMPEEESKRFPFNIMAFESKWHHIHHKSFLHGNYGTITPLYDMLFGTYDRGDGWQKPKKAS